MVEVLAEDGSMAEIISEKQTRQLIDMGRALKLVEAIFQDRAAGKMRSLPRRRLKASQKQLNVMAAWQAEWDLIALRAYTGEANTITLYNGRSGAIQAVVNAGYLSSLRTGAASGVAAKYLAPKNPQVLGIVGPGWQGTFQVEAIAGACPVGRVLVFGRNPKNRKAFIRDMAKETSLDFEEAASLAELEAESDILVLATDSSTPVIDGKELKEEVLIITMGANQPVKHEVSGELIRRMDLVVTDDLPTAKTGSGDLIAACDAGILRWEEIVPLEKIVGNGGPAQRPKKILFQSNGIADEDLAVARYVWEQARRKKIRVRRVGEI
ncbi:MAG: ornithine cyclodeaminase family protein [Deltaproteobacteria bacterium]|nr:ornithine cyclodeaminase family protein [Deltaproteobacteria bacterium]